MNEDQYLEKSGILLRKIRAARRDIGSYTADDVRIIDKDDIHNILSNIKETIMDAVENIKEFMDTLTALEFDERRIHWDSEIKDIQGEERSNATAVKIRMQELISSNSPETVVPDQGSALFLDPTTTKADIQARSPDKELANKAATPEFEEPNKVNTIQCET